MATVNMTGAPASLMEEIENFNDWQHQTWQNSGHGLSAEEIQRSFVRSGFPLEGYPFLVQAGWIDAWLARDRIQDEIKTLADSSICTEVAQANTLNRIMNRTAARNQQPRQPEPRRLQAP
jgi:hypothetical protein